MINQELIDSLPIKEEGIPPITSKGGEIRVLISPKTVYSKHLIMGSVILQPDENIIAHVHEYGEEAIFVQSGMGILYLNTHKIHLETNSCVFIPKGAVHKIVNYGQKPLKLIFSTSPLAPSDDKGDKIIKL
jgi:cupin 2 barrel domain protein